MEFIYQNISIKYNNVYNRYIVRKGDNWVSLTLSIFDMLLSTIRTCDSDSLKFVCDFVPFNRVEIIRLYGNIEVRVYNNNRSFISCVKFDKDEVCNLNNSLEMINNMVYRNVIRNDPQTILPRSTSSKNQIKAIENEHPSAEIQKPQNTGEDEIALVGEISSSSNFKTPPPNSSKALKCKKNLRKRPVSKIGENNPTVPKFSKLEFDNILSENFFDEML